MITSVTGQAFLHHRHLVALLAVEIPHLGGVAHHHHAHAVGAGIGLDRHVGRVLDAVLQVLEADLSPAASKRWRRGIPRPRAPEVDLAAVAVMGIEQPGVDLQQPREFARDLVVGGKVRGLAAGRPAAWSGGISTCPSSPCRISGMPADRSLLTRIAQGSKSSTPSRAPVRFSGSSRSFFPLAVSSSVFSLFEKLPRRTSNPVWRRIAASVATFSRYHLLRVWFSGQQQQFFASGTDLLDCAARGLHRERHERGREVVEAAGKRLVSTGASLKPELRRIHRAVERRFVLQPAQAEPALDRGVRVEYTLLQLEQRTVQRRS
jgi:hypothetical protein